MGESRTSPAILVVALALVAAVAGTAFAGTDATTSAINKKKVKKIAAKQIDKRVPWGTDDIADGAVTSSKLADGAVRVRMRQGPDATIGAGTFGSAEASCQPGELATGGGVYNESNVLFLQVTSSYPTPNPTAPPATGNDKEPTGWRVWMRNDLPAGNDRTVNAYVICAA